MQSLRDYVMVTSGALPSELARAILDEYSASHDWIKLPYTKGNGAGSVVSLLEPRVLRGSARRAQLGEQVRAAVIGALHAYHERFSRSDEGYNFLMLTQCAGFRLLRYAEGEGLAVHVDKYPELMPGQHGWPLVSCSIAVNDDFEGGELSLLDGEMVVPPRAGQAVIFPSTFLYPHSVNLVRRGVRYSLTAWAF